MAFGLGDPRLFLSAFALALLGVAVVLFLIILIWRLLAWAKIIKGKPKEPPKPPVATGKDDGITRITAKRNAQISGRLDFTDEAGALVGYTVTQKSWNNAALPSIYIGSEKAKELMAAEARPLKQTDAGVLCVAVNPSDSIELALIGTVYMKEGWRGAPKPLYDLNGNFQLGFKNVESVGGLVTAQVYDSSRKNRGSVSSKGKNEWLLEFQKDIPLKLHVLLLAFAQLVGEADFVGGKPLNLK